MMSESPRTHGKCGEIQRDRGRMARYKREKDEKDDIRIWSSCGTA